MSTNVAKTLVWKHEYDVKWWRHKQRTPNTNDHHMPLIETLAVKIFCRRHWSQQTGRWRLHSLSGFCAVSRWLPMWTNQGSLVCVPWWLTILVTQVCAEFHVIRYFIQWRTQGFPRPGLNSVLAPGTQPVHGSIDAKNKLRIKGRRKLTRALQSPAYSCFWTRLKTSCDCDVTELRAGLLNLGNH